MSTHIKHHVITGILTNPVLEIKASGSSLEIHIIDPVPENLTQTKSLPFKDLFEIINRTPQLYDE